MLQPLLIGLGFGVPAGAAVMLLTARAALGPRRARPGSHRAWPANQPGLFAWALVMAGLWLLAFGLAGVAG